MGRVRVCCVQRVVLYTFRPKPSQHPTKNCNTLYTLLMQHPYTLNQLQQILATIDELDGWDFSRVRREHDPLPWNYMDIVPQYLKPTSRVLDIGTGGGEKFFSLASQFGEGVAVDHWPRQIESAKRNLVNQSIDNVTVALMGANALQFADASFDIVLTRHLRVYPSEILRVLRPGGYFITQQVGQFSSMNILDAFGWTPASFGPDWWQPTTQVANEFRALGCHIVAQAEYDVPFWYQDIESFLFWLTSVPWPASIELEKHWQNINRLLDSAKSERGIKTNEHRCLLIVQKN